MSSHSSLTLIMVQKWVSTYGMVLKHNQKVVGYSHALCIATVDMSYQQRIQDRKIAPRGRSLSHFLLPKAQPWLKKRGWRVRAPEVVSDCKETAFWTHVVSFTPSSQQFGQHRQDMQAQAQTEEGMSTNLTPAMGVLTNDNSWDR